MIRLIAVDLDDTLLGDDKLISAANKQAIQEAVGAGVHIVIATARGWFSTKFFSEELGLRGYAVCGSGTKIYDHTGTCVKTWHIPLSKAKDILSFAAREKIMVVCSTPEKNLFNFVTDEWRPYIRPEIDVEVPDLHLELTEAPTQLFLKGQAEVERMKSYLPLDDPDFAVHTLLYRDNIPEMMIIHPEANKAAGLAWVCSQLGVNQEEVLALGDSANDVPMLKWAGVGVAMGWAPQPVQESADFVTKAEDLDGVATAIRKYVFKG